MRILVTGGAGRVGAAVVERLAGAGHTLTVIGRSAREGITGARYVRGDITDPDALASVVRGNDSVVHLAAIPSPGGGSPEEIFRVNAAGTFAVYEAAARAGIRRVVSASSINAFGYNFGVRSFPVRAFPIDEGLPGFTTDPYSFSKQVTERIADYAWRRDGISGACLRLPYVAPAARSSREQVAGHAALCRASFASLMELPEQRRHETVAGWMAGADALRAERFFETSRPRRHYENPDPLMLGRTDFWTRIDERDSAQAVEKALAASYDGSPVLFVNDSHNVTGVPSAALARLFFPEAALDEERLAGTATLVSIEAARALIGFEPEHSVGRWLADS